MQVLAFWIDRKDDQNTDVKTLRLRGTVVTNEWACVDNKVTGLEAASCD